MGKTPAEMHNLDNIANRTEEDGENEQKYCNMVGVVPLATPVQSVVVLVGSPPLIHLGDAWW